MFNNIFKPIELIGDKVRLIDQRLIPEKEIWRKYSEAEEIVVAIKEMIIRGAPAIGIAGAYGVYIGALNLKSYEKEEFFTRLKNISDLIANARPTAVNLSWAVKRMINKAGQLKDADAKTVEIISALREESIAIHTEDMEMNMKIGNNGADLMPENGFVMTHCNAGALATGGYGTALGVLRSAREKGKKFKVLVCETRPFLQGARLTAWELQRDGFDVTLITDNMVGHFMKLCEIKCVIVGADRIARNGDTANKIGTYSHAILASHHNIPFYVAAPTSTLDPEIEDGIKIIIEERDELEVSTIAGKRICPEGINIRNPAFDVTPAKYITAIITDKGVFKQPYKLEE